MPAPPPPAPSDEPPFEASLPLLHFPPPLPPPPPPDAFGPLPELPPSPDVALQLLQPYQAHDVSISPPFPPFPPLVDVPLQVFDPPFPPDPWDELLHEVLYSSAPPPPLPLDAEELEALLPLLPF